MKKIPIRSGAAKSLLRRLAVGSILIALILPIKSFIWRQVMPFGISMPTLDGQVMVDPRAPITLTAEGLGTRLSRVEMRDESGKIIAEAVDQTTVTLPSPLAFGTRHAIKATAERPWFGQQQTRELAFTTVGIPKLEGPTQRMLAPDASVTLHFDRPVGDLQASGDLNLRAEPDESHRTIRLVASDYAQNQTFSVQFNWKTTTGVPLPPFSLELTTAPPLSAEANTRGLANVGLALPLQLTFSEPLADRANAGKNIQVETVDGKSVSGKWDWQGQRHLKFTPQPAWPASSAIQVNIGQHALKTLRGGMLEKPFSTRFSTGSDRRIFVYLNSQQLVAKENGQVVRTFKVSTGKKATPTVTGSYYIYDRYPHKTMRSDVGRGQKGFYEVEDVPYTQFFHKDFAFHGAFWHNGFGHPASHGCVNLSTKDKNKRWPNAPEDAGWLYRWASLGVPVTVLRESPGESPPLQAGQEKGSDKDKPAAKLETAEPGQPMVKLDSGIAQGSAGTP